MARRYVLHESAIDQVKERFSRIKLRNRRQSQSRKTYAKVSKSFLLLYDRYIVFFMLIIPLSGGKKEGKISYTFTHTMGIFSR
jgi:hypothetical protein